MAMLKIDGHDVSNVFSQYDVEWIDLSAQSTRNMSGTMKMKVVATKYKIILTLPPMLKAEFVNFFQYINNSVTHTVQYFNPFTGQMRTAQCYRGDRKATIKWNIDPATNNVMNESTTISLIEL